MQPGSRWAGPPAAPPSWGPGRGPGKGGWQEGSSHGPASGSEPGTPGPSPLFPDWCHHMPCPEPAEPQRYHDFWGWGDGQRTKDSSPPRTGTAARSGTCGQ